MKIEELINQVKDFLFGLENVKSVEIYGSFANGKPDELSDIDMEIKLSNGDASKFIMNLPAKLNQKFDVVFHDFAPSLAPKRYLVTIAFNFPNPFRMFDIACDPINKDNEYSKEDLKNNNIFYFHILKLFSANLKHYLRKGDNHEDIDNMYFKLFTNKKTLKNNEKLAKTYAWLIDNAKNAKLKNYVLLYEDKIKALKE